MRIKQETQTKEVQRNFKVIMNGKYEYEKIAAIVTAITSLGYGCIIDDKGIMEFTEAKQ